MVMKRSLPNFHIRLNFSYFSCHARFILRYYLFRIGRTTWFQNQNHMNMIWHHYIFINSHMLVMLFNLAHMILRNDS